MARRLAFVTVSTANSFQTLYGSDVDRRQVAETMNSHADLVMTGPSHYLTDYHIGAMRGYQMLDVMVGLMSVL